MRAAAYMPLTDDEIDDRNRVGLRTASDETE